MAVFCAGPAFGMVHLGTGGRAVLAASKHFWTWVGFAALCNLYFGQLKSRGRSEKLGSGNRNRSQVWTRKFLNTCVLKFRSVHEFWCR